MLRGVSIEIFSGHEITALRAAGRVARQTLDSVAARVRPGVSTMDIDRWVREDTRGRQARPSQLGYQGFPAAVCTSRNEVVCHGIPSASEIVEDGDIINVDVTSEYGGFHGDTSVTLLVGRVSPEAKHLVQVTERCLALAIATVRPGIRLSDIGQVIEDLATKEGCSVVQEYCGHGIGRVMHAPPSVPHVGPGGRGPRLRAGMAFTIEPMLNLGSAEVELLADGWTVVSRDRSLSAQFEHTVLVTSDGAEILTQSARGIPHLQAERQLSPNS